MELLIKCERCHGETTKSKYTYLDKETTVIERIPCTKCKGKGYKVMKGHYLSYELLRIKRETDRLWKIIKHERRIPSEYFYNAADYCKECDGMGYIETRTEEENKTIIKKKTCTTCNGKGQVKIKTTKDIYNEIFNKYLGYKKQRDEIVQALKNKEWEDEKYKDYIEAHPYGYWEVCVRCTNYHDEYACMGCVNESMCPENGCDFIPIDEKARKWFVDKGYKKCIGYEPKYKKWRNAYLKEGEK